MAPKTLAALSALIAAAVAVDNGLARTPQLGWNNWNSLGCDVSEELLLQTSQKLLDLGLRDVGYNYVVLDDCWSDGRDEKGYLVADKKKFPRGMKFVADSIHEKGLLYGMYSSAGEYTCALYAGSLDHEEKDAQAFASWEVDYLKYDNCFSLGRHGTPKLSYDRFDAMAKALNATGRPMLYSLCNWGEDFPHTWGMSIANSWRMSGDIYDSFSRPDVLCSCDDPKDPHCISPGLHCSVLNILNKVAPYTIRGQPGGWNDLDMLEVGLGGMSDDEYKAHFSMWALVKSPLLIGADIRKLPPSALTILNNPAIIAINQDPAGRPADRVRVDRDVKKDKYGVGEAHVWSGPLKNGDQVVAFFNAADEDLKMEASLEEIFVGDGPGGSAPQVNLAWEVYDLWGGRMSDKVAQKLVDASEKGVGIEKAQKAADWYNATEVPYAEGLKAEDSRLFGTKVGEVKAQGTLKATVKRHSVEVFRLRNRSGEEIKRYAVSREL